MELMCMQNFLKTLILILHVINLSDYADENSLKYWSKELHVERLFKKKLSEICKIYNIN